MTSPKNTWGIEAQHNRICTANFLSPLFLAHSAICKHCTWSAWDLKPSGKLIVLKKKEKEKCNQLMEWICHGNVP